MLTLRPAVLIDGLCMVANAENPRFIENKHRGYIEP